MNPWDNKRSVLLEDADGLGRITYHGVLIFQEIEFRFKLTPQNNGKYVYRGRISAISPADGMVVQVKGREATRRLGNSDTIVKDAEKKRDKRLNLFKEVYTQVTTREGIKAAILRATRKLYIDHAVLLTRELQKSIRAETITPGVAAVLFSDNFVATNFRNENEEMAKRHAQRIKEVFSMMPSIPMVEYKHATITNFLKSQNISQNMHRTIFQFWEYLILKGHISGSNPVPLLKKKKSSSGSKQRNAQKLTELTVPQQDALYDLMMRKSLCGGDCGVALLTWSNLPAGKEILRWKDVIMDPARRDFVLIKYRRDDLAGATHSFVQPQPIQVARILWKQKEKLLVKYQHHELLNMPVIALQKNPKKAMKMSALIQYAGTLLRSIGIEEKYFAAKNKVEKTAVAKQILQMTHQKNIYQRYGLDGDEGTKQYLQLESLRKSVTDDNYVSFSDEDAQGRIYVVQLAIRPQEKLPRDEMKTESLPDSISKFTISPEHTRERVGLVGTFEVPPGATITIRCPHGVTGEYRAREIKKDGTLKRKSKKQSYTDMSNCKPDATETE